MCGIVAVVGGDHVNQDLYDALTVMQHRGQDAAGIVTCDGIQLNQCKGNGLVRDVFNDKNMRHLAGHLGIGHVRYPTAGSSSPALAQPFYVNSPYGISLAHNGNLTNAESLTQALFKEDLRHINTDSDSEVLLNVFAHELQQLKKLPPSPSDIFQALTGMYRRCSGGYAAVALIVGYGVVAFRDPHGIRPIVYGQRQGAQGIEYMIASESVALSALGYTLVRDLKPGEAIYITNDGEVHMHQCVTGKSSTPCIFEYVYFSRPDSILDGISVYKTRIRMGEYLAKKILAERPDHGIDVVIPVPDTSRVAAQSLAYHMNVKFREGLIKNRYIGRTFIMPGQSQRKKSVRQKLNPIDLEFKGKHVLLVDDSIVRGTTCKEIIDMARKAGAKSVSFASAAPAICFPNVYGIDMPSAQELVAHRRSTEQVRQAIGADWLVYQDLSDLIASCQKGNADIDQFDCSVFDGNYVTNDVDEHYFLALHAKRNDESKTAKTREHDALSSSVALHNQAHS